VTASTPRFDVVDEPGAGAGIVAIARAALRRIRPKLLLAMLAALAATHAMQYVLHLLTRTMYRQTPDSWKIMTLIESLVIVSVGFALLVGDELVARGAPRLRTYSSLVTIACAFAATVQLPVLNLLGWDHGWEITDDLIALMQPWQMFFDAWIYSALASIVYVHWRTARLAADRMRAAELVRARSRRRTFESRLQAMQARVEPQFLFNTLALVRELYEHDTATADRMLDDLIAYLRAALPHLRESSSTLGQEVELARAYLDIMQIRLGERLTFEIDLPEGAKHARMPPMMLLPLIDHAIVHGLQPADASGTIHIRSEAGNGRLRLSVTDSGVSFLPGSNATGLDNISQRLHALYGDKARFELERMRERGTRALLEIPYEDADGGDR
jgi:Histidine kinase